MRFSIIVPVFNTGRHLERCIAALTCLDYPRHEYDILMVDTQLGRSLAVTAGMTHRSGME